MDSNGIINNIAGPFGAFNNMKDSESFPVVKEIINGNPILTYANSGGRNEDALQFRRSDAFQAGDKIGAGHNPVVVNRPFYHWSSARLDPVYFNGLSLEVLERKNGTAKIKVRFNETEITKNTRWCGNIIVKNVPAARNNHAVSLRHGATVTIDKSGVPNTHLAPFIRPTVLTIDSGAVFYIGERSTVQVLEESTVIIKKGGTLKMDKNAGMTIDEDSRLEIHTGAQLLLDKSATIDAAAKKCFQAAPGAILNRMQNIRFAEE
jgi:hypothetical protein